MRATDLLGTTVVAPDGTALGHVVDVRLAQDGPMLGADCALRIEGFVVGPRRLASQLGYDRSGVRGPALVAAITRRLTAANRLLPWEQVQEIAPGTIRSTTAELPAVPMLGGR